MTMRTETTRLGHSARRALAVAGLLAMLAPGAAWALYKVVGPDGRVTYTDRAPSDRAAKALNPRSGAAAAANLPYGLRQVAERYPVVLYTGPACTPCDSARALLKDRGIPFQELTVQTSDDIAAFRRKEGTDQLPVLRIGSQQLQGLSTQDWLSYLDTAGYPASSQLPAGYAWPAAAPMTAPKPAATPAVPAPADLPPPAAADTAPRGFRF
jgi:glutaredoxin